MGHSLPCCAPADKAHRTRATVKTLPVNVRQTLLMVVSPPWWYRIASNRARAPNALDRARRPVKGNPLSCREQMICPLPRASEVSAFRAVQAIAMVSQGGDHGLRRGRGGAGDESPRGHHAGVEWSAELAAGGGHFGDRSAQPAAVAGPV